LIGCSTGRSAGQSATTPDPTDAGKAVFMVVEVLAAERDGEYPLSNQRCNRMLDLRLGSPIDEARCQPIHHPDRPIRRPQQQRTRVRCDRATVKRRDHLAAFDGFKSKTIRDTLCLHRGSPRIIKKSLSQNNFR
jgi:hypothetical protein